MLGGVGALPLDPTLFMGEGGMGMGMVVGESRHRNSVQTFLTNVVLIFADIVALQG